MGGFGVDHLYGNANGAFDVLVGGADRDHLHMATSSADAGTLAWLEPGMGADVLYGFRENKDNFLIEKWRFGIGERLDSWELRNNVTGHASGTHAQFIFEQDTGVLWFDSNGNQSGGRQELARFDNMSGLVDNNGDGLKELDTKQCLSINIPQVSRRIVARDEQFTVSRQIGSPHVYTALKLRHHHCRSTRFRQRRRRVAEDRH
ncbi:MAG: hypothetical protein ACT4N2_13335 [Hyphomicrobium sp.]